MSLISNFYAILQDNTVRRVGLIQRLIPDIRDLFLEKGAKLLALEDLVEFDGNYRVHEGDDELLFVSMDLPAAVAEAKTNAMGIVSVDITNDQIKALFWYEDDCWYFQNFDSRRLLKRKKILFLSKGTFDELKDDAFVVEEMVNAIYKDGKYLFQSYINANKIFSLSSVYHEATKPELISFAANNKVSIDEYWLLTKANSVIKRNISLLLDSKVLDNADTSKVKADALVYDIDITLNEAGKIVFSKNLKKCKEVLTFLNEQFYTGPITGKQFQTNNKREVKNKSSFI